MPISFFQLNIFKEFQVIDQYLQKSLSNPKIVWTNLKNYFDLFFIWEFMWKKCCIFFNFKKKIHNFWNWRTYFLFGKWKWYSFLFKNLFLSYSDSSFRKIQNQYLERIIHFIIEPLFEFCFKFFAFGFRPFNTIQIGVQCLRQHLQKYPFIWVLSGELHLLVETCNCDLFFSILKKRVWDIFLLKIIKSWIISSSNLFNAKFHFFFPFDGSNVLFTFFINLYFEFFDTFFVCLIFVLKKNRGLVINSLFFCYSYSSNLYIYSHINYRFLCDDSVYIWKKNIGEHIKYIRISYNFFFLQEMGLNLF